MYIYLVCFFLWNWNCSLLHQQDLEQYAAQYSGLAKLNRLLFIADHCPMLRVEALRMALAYVMNTYNTSLYQQIHRKLQEAVTS